MRLKAYAKVNLFLNVVNKRIDGYHDLEMVNVLIDLYDKIQLKKIKEKIIIKMINSDISLEDNIVYKVATYLKHEYKVKEGVEIKIAKKIPVGGGLAGGSSDAASVLKGLNKLWKLNLTANELSRIGLKFGADIPFLLYGKPAVVRGIGDIIEPIKLDLHNLRITLYTNKVNVSTKEVFTNLKEYNKYPLNDYLAYLQKKDFGYGCCNGLIETTFSLFPELENIYNKLINSSPNDKIMMSGSGSTLYIISSKEPKYDENVNKLLYLCEIRTKFVNSIDYFTK